MKGERLLDSVLGIFCDANWAPVLLFNDVAWRVYDLRDLA